MGLGPGDEFNAPFGPLRPPNTGELFTASVDHYLRAIALDSHVALYRAWPWLQPDTALLVWDPAHEGRIVSGRQLFGSVTWWMFWKNGFEPLAALDDDGDGWLTGNELAGISIWQDRNGNGISDPGEVIPASDFGIQALAVRPEGKIEGVPANCFGVVLRDGSTLTLFDWTPQGLRSAN